MKIEVSKVKGFQDYLPPESLKRKKIKKIVEENFKLYGFLPVETPIIEFDEMMRPEVTTNEDEAVADRFRLKDRGGRNLGLRYEFTFQLSRIFKENPNIKLPFKRFQIGNIFRDEPLKQGRTRQFTQCDADIIGDSSINADTECMAVVNDIFKELKVDVEIQVNNRKLLNSIIESVEIKSFKQVLRELDKLEKIGADNVKANLRQFASPNQIVTLFKLLEKDLDFYNENAFDGSSELEELIRKCKLYGLKVKFNPTMVRGFEYYTGNVFEFFVNGKNNSLAAGGRYDKVVGKYLGKEIPAVGASFSLEALTNLCPEQISQLKTEKYPKVLIISFNQERVSISLAKKLRKNKVSCSMTEGQPSKALEYANALQIPYVIFLGENEVSENKFKLKNMISGDEKLFTEKQLINKLK
jgi:histidyl-tRNA synthetase